MSKLKINRVKTILRNVIENNLDLAELNVVPKALAIEGEPGTAKTSAVEQVVKEYGDKFNYIKLDLSGLTTDDLIGYPLVEYYVTKNNENAWVSKETLPNFTTLGYHPTGETRMGYAIPMWLQGKTEKSVIVVLDDYNRC